MGKGNKKSAALKSRRKAKKNEKRARKEMEKAQMQQEAQMQQSEIEEENEDIYTGEVRSIDEIVEEMKTIQQKRQKFTERIQYDVEEPIDKKMQQVLERERAEEADRKRDIAYKKVVYKILRGEEEK